MDVSCPRCKTDYEFDDARVPDAGVTVKCTQCSHVFRVRKKSVPSSPSIMPPPQKPGDETEPGLPRHASATREWKVRQPSGNVFSFKELTTLQKWIVERKVSRDDEISLTGEAWKRLGNIAELASFFQIVDDAKKVHELEALQQMQQKMTTRPESAPAPPPLPVHVHVHTGGEDSGVKAASQSGSHPMPGERAGVLQMPVEATSFPPRAKSSHEAPTLPPDEQSRPSRPKLTETLRDPSFVMPPPRSKEERPPPFRVPPPPREVPSELVEIQAREDLRSYKRNESGGAGKWIALFLILLGAGGAAGWYFVVFAPEQQRQKELADIQARASSEEEARVKTEEAVRAEADKKAKDDKDAVEKKKKDEADKALSAMLAAQADAGAGPADAGAAEATATSEKEEGAKKKPAGCKNADCFISQADRLRDRERPEAALDAYGKALDLKPENVEALTGKGLCYLDMAKPLLAEPVLEQALKLNPRYAPAIMGLAESYRFQGKKEQAIAAYQKYLDNFPNGPEAGVAKSNIDRLR
jgi:predicted Zn finger-like uncharacterized protein